MAHVDWKIKGPETHQLQLRLGMPLPIQRASDTGELPRGCRYPD